MKNIFVLSILLVGELSSAVAGNTRPPATNLLLPSPPVIALPSGTNLLPAMPVTPVPEQRGPDIDVAWVEYYGPRAEIRAVHHYMDPFLLVPRLSFEETSNFSVIVNLDHLEDVGNAATLEIVGIPPAFRPEGNCYIHVNTHRLTCTARFGMQHPNNFNWANGQNLFSGVTLIVHGANRLMRLHAFGS